MKKLMSTIFKILFIGLPLFANTNDKSIPATTLDTEDKIVINVRIENSSYGVSGALKYGIVIVQAPTSLSTNRPIPLEIHTENVSSSSSSQLYLHIHHIKGSLEDTNNDQFFGATGSIPIPPTGPGSGPSFIIYDELPQEDAEYLFSEGSHTLDFRLSFIDNPSLSAPHIDGKKVDFSISSALPKSDKAYTSAVQVYPNPFIDEVTFNLQNTNKFLEDKTVTLTIYNQNGVVQDVLNTRVQKDNKIIYQNSKLVKGRYYYTLNTNTGQNITTGVLLKN